MSRIASAIEKVPPDCGIGEGEDGTLVHWEGFDFKVTMAISISEFELPLTDERTLRAMGVINLGHLIVSSRSILSGALTSEGFAILDEAISEIGYSFGMPICKSRLSDYELVNTNDGLIKTGD